VDEPGLGAVFMDRPRRGACDRCRTPGAGRWRRQAGQVFNIARWPRP